MQTNAKKTVENVTEFNFDGIKEMLRFYNPKEFKHDLFAVYYTLTECLIDDEDINVTSNLKNGLWLIRTLIEIAEKENE